MKGYYPAKLGIIKVQRRAKDAKIEERLQLQVEAGLVHEISADTLFDVWPSHLNLSERPLATCKALKVSSLRTILDWKPRDDIQPPRTLIAKPHKTSKPILKYYISDDLKPRFTKMIEASSAHKVPFCLSETAKDLADIELTAIDDGLSYEVLAPEETSLRQSVIREVGPLEEMWDFLKEFTFYYHKLRHDNALPATIVAQEGAGTVRKAFMSMFELEVYQLDDETFEHIGENFNIPGRGVHLVVDDDEDILYTFKMKT